MKVVNILLELMDIVVAKAGRDFIGNLVSVRDELMQRRVFIDFWQS